MMNYMEDNNINNGNLNTDSQNVYTVGSQPGDAGCNGTASAGGNNGTSCGNGTGGSYTPPGCGDYRSGEYSYKGGEKIPEYRYTYSNKSDGRQSHAKGKRPKGKKPGRSHTAVIVTLVIVAAMLMGLLAGIAGTMIARYHDDNRGTQGQVQDITGNTANQGQDPGTNTSSDQTPTGADVVIIKNDGSVTVKTVKGKIGDESLTVPDVVALVKNSVVEIFTEQRVYSGWYVSSGAGSGVIIGKSEDGTRAYVVTNNHVIADADTVNVRLADGTKYTAEVVGTDSVTDVADLGTDLIENKYQGSGRTIKERLKDFDRYHGLTREDAIFFNQSDLICKMAKEEDFIVMGRCADVILANNRIPHISIFITAPFEQRVHRIMEVNNIDYKKAWKLLKRQDRMHAKYYHHFTGLKWGDAMNYDICFNSASYGIEESVDIIERMLNQHVDHPKQAKDKMNE